MTSWRIKTWQLAKLYVGDGYFSSYLKRCFFQAFECNFDLWSSSKTQTMKPRILKMINVWWALLSEGFFMDNFSVFKRWRGWFILKMKHYLNSFSQQTYVAAEIVHDYSSYYHFRFYILFCKPVFLLNVKADIFDLIFFLAKYDSETAELNSSMCVVKMHIFMLCCLSRKVNKSIKTRLALNFFFTNLINL